MQALVHKKDFTIYIIFYPRCARLSQVPDSSMGLRVYTTVALTFVHSNLNVNYPYVPVEIKVRRTSARVKPFIGQNMYHNVPILCTML